MTSAAEKKRRFEAFKRRRRHYLPHGIPPGDTEDLTTGGAPTDMSGTLRLSKLTSGTTGGEEEVTIGDGTSLDFIKIVELFDVTSPDFIAFSSLANIQSGDERTVTKIELTEAGHFVMFRWTGSGGKWEIVRSHRGVTIEVG